MAPNHYLTHSIEGRPSPGWGSELDAPCALTATSPGSSLSWPESRISHRRDYHVNLLLFESRIS